MPVAALSWARTRLAGGLALVGILGLASVVGTLVVCWRRAAARRRRRAIRFDLRDIDAADDREYRRIVGQLLIRDGWRHVRGVRVTDHVIHVVGERDGRRLGVAFERGAGGLGSAVLRALAAVPSEPMGQIAPLLIVVSTGRFSRDRVLWAARTGVRLVDRHLLGRWAAGEDLLVLLGLSRQGA